MADLSYLEQLSNLDAMSDQDLDSLKATVLNAFENADAADDLDAMSAAADALEQVNAVQLTRAGDVTDDVNDDNGDDSAETPADTSAPDAAMPVAASAADEPVEDVEPVDAEADTAATEESETDEEVVDDAPVDGTDEADAVDAPADAGSDAVTADASGDDEDTGDPEEDDPVTAGGKTPPQFKGHQFKKKGAKASADAEDAADGGIDEDEEDAVTAASNTETEVEESEVPVEQKDLPAERQPLVASASAPVVTAGADIPGVPAGYVYANERELSTAFSKRLDAFRGGRGSDGDKVVVASVVSEVTDEGRMLNDRDSTEVTADKINAVVREMQTMTPGTPAIVASGGYCAPLEVRYSIFGVGVTDRPIRDSLAGFQATRGGIRYVAPPVLSSFSGAVGLWTAANDANPSSPATKPFLTAVCQNAIDVTLDAITLEIQFGNLMTRAYPELVARNNELGLIYQARFAEQTLLSKISALSTAVTAGWQLGTARDFLNSVGRLATAYRTRHRLGPETAMRVIAPAWVRDAMREDLTRGSVAGGEPGQGIQWADSLINAALAARNINITWHLDDSTFTGAQNAGAINDFPAAIVYYLFAEGTFLFLDGGTLDLGIVRDSTLVGTNDYRMFVETFEGLAKVGIESIKATVTTHITGANVGTVTPS